MLLNGGELGGIRILAPETVQLMTTNSLPPDVHFVQDMIGPASGASWGLGFAIRTNAEFSAVPGAVGSFTWGGVWGTKFWIDPTEKLITVQMIQVAPGESGPYSDALRNLTYGALRVPEQPPIAPPLSMSADALAEYVGKYDFGPSSSSRDRRAPAAGVFAGVGIQIAMASGRVEVIKPFDGAPAARAGVAAGDVITHLDSLPVENLTFDQVLGKFRGPANSAIRLTIQHKDQDRPIDITIVRKLIHIPGVQLQVRLDAGKLTIESAGAWPILEFEAGTPIAATAISATEFYADSADHTRIAFIRDASGKVSGAILNPGPWEQKGMRLD
jgi:hypothetical protein